MSSTNSATAEPEHRWLLRCSDRSPEGLKAFAEKNADLIDFATQPWWGDQMRNPIAQDAEMYGLDEPDPATTAGSAAPADD